METLAGSGSEQIKMTKTIDNGAFHEMSSWQLRMILRAVPLMSSNDVQALLAWMEDRTSGRMRGGNAYLAQGWREMAAEMVGRQVTVTLDDEGEDVLVRGKLLGLSGRGVVRVLDSSGQEHEVGPIVFVDSCS